MNNLIKIFFCSVFCIFLASSLTASAQTTIEIFTDAPLMVPAVPRTIISVFDLSRVDAIKKTAPRFPPDPELAAAQAKAWFASEEGKSYVEKLKNAYESRTKLVAYGVRKIPAIVFDGGKFVIYGTTDVLQAVDDYDHYMRTHTTAGEEHVTQH